MRDEILATVAACGGSGVSFAEMDRRLGDAMRGGQDLTINGDRTRVAWPACSEAFVDAMVRLVADGVLVVHTTRALVYYCDGLVPRLDMGRATGRPYARRRWVPCVVGVRSRA